MKTYLLSLLAGIWIFYPMIDPLIEFEFSRSVTSPKEANKMDAFIKSEIFTPVSRSQEIFIKIQDNAFILSKIIHYTLAIESMLVSSTSSWQS
jgi:hypothetical protein